MPVTVSSQLSCTKSRAQPALKSPVVRRSGADKFPPTPARTSPGAIERVNKSPVVVAVAVARTSGQTRPAGERLCQDQEEERLLSDWVGACRDESPTAQRPLYIPVSHWAEMGCFCPCRDLGSGRNERGAALGRSLAAGLEQGRVGTPHTAGRKWRH
jgi:hypothetical protein